jgi:YVTN family beta-propeller protein
MLRLDPTSGKPVGNLHEISRYLGQVALAARDGVWIAQAGIRQPDLLRLDEDREGFEEHFTAGKDLTDLALSEADIWALDLGSWEGFGVTAGGTVERLDRETGRTVARIQVGRAPAAISIGAGSVWVTNNLDDTLSRIDPRTNRVVATIPVGSEPVGLAVGYGSVWIASYGEDTLSRIDPGRNEVIRTIHVGRGPRGIAVGEDGVWVTNYRDDTAMRIDPHTARVVETIGVGAGPIDVEVGSGAVWVADMLDRSVSRIEP